MALTIDLDLAIATSRETATITDSTVYGGDNAARADVAVYLTGYKVDSAGTETALTVTGDDSDPETDSVWTITLSDQDGYYKFPFVIIPDYDVAETYEIYDAVYSGGVVYRSKANANTGNSVSDTAWFEVITDPSDLANNKDTSTESLNISSQVYVRVLRPNSQYEFANQLSNQGLYMDTDDLEFTLSDYNLFAMWLDGAEIADSRSEVIDGEVIARRIESKFISE